MTLPVARGRALRRGFARQFAETKQKEASAEALLEAVRRVAALPPQSEVKVLLGGKRITGDMAVSTLRNSSPLLVLGAAAASGGGPASPGAGSPHSSLNASLNASQQMGSPQSPLQVDDEAARRRNAADRALEMEEAKLDKLSEAALELGRQNGEDGDYYAEIVDQNGKRVNMPEADKRNLTAAQLLHEHGKKLMAASKFEDAIKVLRDSIRLFMLVSPALLKIVDNYGLACLDISWSYLKLGNMNFLATAREHLQNAKLSLELAHGKNMERLIQVKGEDYVVQKTLYVRLAVLQGVVAWHRGEHVSAQSYFAYAEDQARELRIEDGEVEPLLQMGFSRSEARRGMRLAHKDTEQAVLVIMARREQLQQQARDRQRQRRQQRLGQTASGEYVDLDLFDSLVGMGFDQRMSAHALRQANNDLARATEILTQTPELLASSDGARRAQRAEALGQLAAMGFTDARRAKAALKASRGNLEEAAALLLSRSGENEPMEVEASDQPGEEDAMQDEPEPEPEPEAAETEEQRLARERDAEVHAAAKNDLINAINRDRDFDHEDEFDLNLDDEVSVLQHYQKVMLDANKWKM